MLALEDFISICISTPKCPKHLRFVGNKKPKNCTEKKSSRCFYSLQSKEQTQDMERSLWEETRLKVWKRDFNAKIEKIPPFGGVQDKWIYGCRFYKCLTSEEKVIFLKNLQKYFPLDTHPKLQPAHILNQRDFPQYIHDLDNIVLINEFTHACLDINFIDPLTLLPIKETGKKEWFQRIKGER